MAKKTPFTIFTNETADKLLANIPDVGTGNKPKPLKEGVARKQAARNPLDSVVVKIVSEEGDGYYEVQQQIWDDFTEEGSPELYTWVDSLETFTWSAKETAGVTSIAVGTIHIVKPDVGKSGPIWLFTTGGAARPYIKIKTVIDTNNYTADVITPTSATVIEAGVTVKALQPDAGTLPVNTEIFADIVDDVYYIQPSVFYGGGA